MGRIRNKILGFAAGAFVALLGFGAFVCNTNTVAMAEEVQETPVFAMVEGAQVKATSPSGIRFVTEVNELYKQELAKTYSPDEYTWVWGTELTFQPVGDDAYTIDAPTKQWTANGTRWYTALVGIPPKDYLTEITAESYVKIYAADDVEMKTLIYEDTVENAQTRSIAWTASWAMNDGNAGEIFDQYVSTISNPSVTLDKEGVGYLATGKEMTLGATVLPEVDYGGYGVVWRSDNEEVATVDKTGKVKAIGAGMATITASLGDAEDSYKVAVNYTSIDYQDGNASPVIVGGLTALQMTSGDLPAEPYALAVGERNSSSETGNLAYGTQGLEKVANASITVDYDWLEFAFSDKAVGSVEIDFYASRTLAWVKDSNGTFLEITELESGKVRIHYPRSYFEKLSVGEDEVFSFRQGNGLGYLYVDNITVSTKPEACNLIEGFGAAEYSATIAMDYVRNVGVSGNYAYGAAMSGTSSTMYITLSREALGYAFADTTVNAITFDVILSTGTAKIQRGKNAETLATTATNIGSYTYNNKTDTCYSYSVTVTRWHYEKYAQTADLTLRYTGGGTSTIFFVDNIKTVDDYTTALYEKKLITEFANKTSADKTVQTLSETNVLGNKNDVYGVKPIESGNSSTMYMTLSYVYLQELFANTKVRAITFDIILSTGTANVQRGNNAELLQSGATSSDGGYYTYSITLTRAHYTNYAQTKDLILRYTGGGNSTFFFVDNLTVVK